jgi:hypothetical protein
MSPDEIALLTQKVREIEIHTNALSANITGGLDNKGNRIPGIFETIACELNGISKKLDSRMDDTEKIIIKDREETKNQISAVARVVMASTVFGTVWLAALTIINLVGYDFAILAGALPVVGGGAFGLLRCFLSLK